MNMHQLHATHSIVSVVEGDEDARGNICRFLEKSGLRAWSAESAEDFYVSLLRHRADLVIVDLGLPGDSGLGLVRRLAQQRVPVVVLTARGDVECRITALEAGALQYFIKPADLHELVAGVRSLLRRSEISQAPSPSSHVMPWRLDTGAAQLVAPNLRTVPLTTRELELMGHLVAAQGNLVTKQFLVNALGAGNVQDGFHRVESQLTRLRRKTREATEMALPVRAVFGKGLVFVP